MEKIFFEDIFTQCVICEMESLNLIKCPYHGEYLCKNCYRMHVEDETMNGIANDAEVIERQKLASFLVTEWSENAGRRDERSRTRAEAARYFGQYLGLDTDGWVC